MSETPLFRQSLCKVVVAQSPKHAWQAYLDEQAGVKKTTEAKTRGSYVDALLFGVGLDKYEVIDAENYARKADKALRDEVLSRKLIPIKRKQHEAYVAAKAAMVAQLAGHGIVLSGRSQVELRWKSVSTDGTEVECVGTLDHLIVADTWAMIYDLKSCESASPDMVAKKMVQFGAHIQREAYVEAVEANYPHLAGRVDMKFLYAEVNAPYDLNVAAPAGSMRALGARHWRKGVDAWAHGLSTGQWPGYCPNGTVTMIEAKPWQLAEAMAEVSTEEEDDNG